MINKFYILLFPIFLFNSLFSQNDNLDINQESLFINNADSLKLEDFKNENLDSSDAIAIKSNPLEGFNLGFTGSTGFINGDFITNTPLGGSVVLTTPYGLKLGALDFQVSLAFGSYQGKTPNGDYSPTVIGIGGNLTLFEMLFYEGHVGNVGAGPGGRGFGGVSLEKLMNKGLGLPINILVGAEGFLSTKLDETGDESSYWGGLGIRFDYSF